MKDVSQWTIVFPEEINSVLNKQGACYPNVLVLAQFEGY
jgi:hypothetical protein